MNRGSKFQNPMSLSNGSFAKLPSIQNDAVAVKSQPPSVLDRFRALVKEKEEELRLFTGESVLSRDDIVRIYEIVLSSLTFNSKPIITDLTIIAGEQRVHGEGIADAICARIIEGLVDQKLPSLYLLDSIVKNIGKEYIKYFSARLPEVFCEAYAQVHPNMHTAMRHLFGTWSAVFPSSVLHRIEAKLQLSSSVHGQSSSLNSLAAFESPRPAHGIHINPKYLEAKHQIGRSTIDSIGADGVSATGRAGLITSNLNATKKSLASAARIPKAASPYGIGHSGPIEEYNVDSSPRRLVNAASPSRGAMGYGITRMMDKEEDTSEWQARKWRGNSNQQPKTSSTYNPTDGVDLRGPRALISAYGIDEREKNLKRPQLIPEKLDANGIKQKVAIKSWQNTEEEEFDWEDMTPADRRRRMENFSSLQQPDNSTRIGVATKYGASVADYRANWSKDHSVPNSSMEDVSHVNGLLGSVNKAAGISPNVAADLKNHIPSSFARESLIPPLNAKEGPFAESRNFLSTGQQRHSQITNFANGKFGDPSGAVSSFISTHDSPIHEIQPANGAAFTKPYNPANLPSSAYLPSVSAPSPQLQTRDQFGSMNAGTNFVDPRLNKPFHPEQQFDSNRSMMQMNIHPSQRPPASVPLNLQNPVQSSSVQPNLLLPQEVRQNLPYPSSASGPSHAMMPPLNYGYLARGPRPHVGMTSSAPNPGVQPPWANMNVQNMSFNRGQALPPLIRGPHPGSAQPLNNGQHVGQVTSNPQGGGALSGLFNSLVAQGLISLTKQDSVGVEFDQDSLKVRHESAIAALYADLPRQCTTCGVRFKCQEEHSKHMDWHVSKNRTSKNRKTKPSPKWFVSVNLWLRGAEALGTEAVPGFLPTENVVENKEDDEDVAVPADEDQNACALCGEPFDDFYSDETEEWMYKGAVYMYAPARSIAGIDRSQLGPIVHAKCRSDTHQGLPPEDLTKDEEDFTEEGRQRKRQRS